MENAPARFVGRELPSAVVLGCRQLAQIKCRNVLGSQFGRHPARVNCAGGRDWKRDDAAVTCQPPEPGGRIDRAALGHLDRRKVAHALKQVCQLFERAHLDGGRRVLQPLTHFGHRLGPQQVRQVHVLQQLLQQVAVGRQRLQLALGLGRVPLVHVDAR